MFLRLSMIFQQVLPCLLMLIILFSSLDPEVKNPYICAIDFLKYSDIKTLKAQRRLIRYVVMHWHCFSQTKRFKA